MAMLAEYAFAPDAWDKALVASAKAAKATRVVTDHPDLLEREAQAAVAAQNRTGVRPAGSDQLRDAPVTLQLSIASAGLNSANT